MESFDRKQIGKGKWLSLSEIHFKDAKGIPRVWEAADRINSCGAVMIAAKLIPSGKLILIRQFRPPAGKNILEFPAGLIDPGETAEMAAVRELKEETGYSGKVISVSCPGYSSPGLTGETVSLAKMEVLESEQGELQTDFDECENIETLLVDPEKLPELFEQEFSAGNGVDAKLLTYGSLLF